jgi:hypothetical protein
MSNTTMNNSLSIAKAIFMYEKLLKDRKIKRNGAAYKRLDYFKYLQSKGYRRLPSDTR